MKNIMNIRFFFIWAAALSALGATAQQPIDLLVKNDTVTYIIDARGNRILDFSSCGYRKSEVPIPDVPNVVHVSLVDGDNSDRIQRAIDYVATLPADAMGRRGAVLLDKGTYRIDKALRIPASGIVLRGADRDATVLLKNGVDRGAAVYVEGVRDIINGDTMTVTDDYVPVNSRVLHLSSVKGIKPGDRVNITREATKEWIESIGCDIFGGGISALGWKPGDTNLTWDRTVVAVNGDSITLDAPLTVALDAKLSPATVTAYSWPGRIGENGVENLTIASVYDPAYPLDEDHCWVGVSIDNAENCWVRRVNFKHLAGSAVIVQPGAARITVEDCMATDPVSEVGGMRRCTYLTLGQQALFQRCYSRNGIHDFAAGFCAPGPNAFVQCDADEALGFSGSIDAWAPGLLFDVVNIDGHDLSFRNLGQDKNGAGWNTANSMAWQCTAAGIDCYSPAPDAQNRAFGCWSQFSGDGQWGQSNNHVRPRSLFYAQLDERLDSVPVSQSRILPMPVNATSSPTVEAAMALAKEAYQPRLTMKRWIEDAPYTASVDADGIKSVDDIKTRNVVAKTSAPSVYEIANGRLVRDGQLIVGGRQEVPWWNGKLKYNYLPQAKPHVTRFVPGREGTGLTDRIDSVVTYMTKNDIAVLDHNYGLWYERRRDDHERVRRRDGDVWGPFYEQPFARSGQGTAWEGLSKYDLTRPNKWYWSRLSEFAEKGAPEGLLLFNQHYFQHNILEAGAHWVDAPWRSVNNINSTDFPEPVPFAGDKRIFVADMFYDVDHPVRRELHRNYIRQCLDNFADDPNVVHLISAEFTGPQHFVEFWLDVIGEWQRETGKDPMIALSTTKDVQDAILADPERSKLVDIIDIRYWHYNTDGVYAPEGGKNLAPRQHARKMKVGKVTFDEAYKAVSEYATRYPDKAVTYYAQNYPDMAWAVLMGGGSCPAIKVDNDEFLADVAAMKVVAGAVPMLSGDNGAVVYARESGNVSVDLPKGRYSLMSIDPKSGKTSVLNKRMSINGDYQLKADANRVYWFNKL